VLYFDNSSADTADAYLAQGLTEALIVRLGRIERLAVKSRAAVQRYRPGAGDPLGAARALGVRYLVTGNLRRSGERLRVAAELVRTRDGDRLWGEEYELSGRDLFSLEEGIAGAVATAVVGRLLPTERLSIARQPTANLDAYTLYLKGRFEFNRGTVVGYRAAVQYFKRAIVADSTFASAHAGLAEAYGWLSDTQQPPRDLLPDMRAAARRAVAIDPTSAEALTSLANIQWGFDWDPASAERMLRRAIALQPTYAPAHSYLAYVLVHLGRANEALASARRGLELDSATAGDEYLGTLFLTGRFDEVIAQAGAVLRNEPTSLVAHSALGMALAERGDLARAISILRRTLELQPENPIALAVLGGVYAKAGLTADFQRILQELGTRAQKEYVPPILFAGLYAAIGERDSAFAWLDRAVEERSAFIADLPVHPWWDPLREDPRFRALLVRVGLAELPRDWQR
jgi:TolB-like protein/Flp pilus assembly protein TadD